jgi:hypothetical protein
VTARREAGHQRTSAPQICDDANASPRHEGAKAVSAIPQPQPSAGATPATAEPSIGELVSQATEQLSTLVRSEVELAKLEVRTSAKNAGAGVGMFAGAVVLLVFSLTFGFISLAEGLVALGLPRWAAYLVVFGFLLLVVGLLVFLGVRKVKRVKAPQQALDSGKETVAYLRERAPRL